MAKEMEKQKNNVSFSEKDAAILTQRYDANIVLTLLKEVANYPHPKFDWKELVKKTSTGISNAREYQMLWRHLAYGHKLDDNLEDGSEPLDDDSDLECEREALPPITKETASEAQACAKVITASHALSESAPTSSLIEAPLIVNVPKIPDEGSSQSSNLMQETNIIFPVTVPRKAFRERSSSRAKKSEESVSGTTFDTKKRKTWSEEEDMQLRAAVERWGEGNWEDIARSGNFPHKRTPSSLAKRWSTLQKIAESSK